MTHPYEAAAECKRQPLHSALLSWYDANARDLPWRQTDDPYRIWISEIMLQQTRVETGIAYYRRFLKRFPEIGTLARARESSVLKLWEGLGYYSRARNLHRAAKIIQQDFDGTLPDTAAQLRQLPGIGRYTAGAIASIAFDERSAVVDGNVKRVLARLFCIGDCVDEGRTTDDLWALAEDLVPKHRPGDWNQALMELGALVCVPRSPACTACPAQTLCDAFASGQTADVPVRKVKSPVPHKRVAAAYLKHGDKVLIARRRPGGMLAGLWELPGGARHPGESSARCVARILRDELQLSVNTGRTLARVDHAYSHFTMRMDVLAAALVRDEDAGKSVQEAGGYDIAKWVRQRNLHRYAMPQADRNALEIIREMNNSG